MLLCYYELTPTLKPSLALPSAAAVATVSSASFASASVVVANVLILILVVVIHLVPLLQAPLPAPGRRAWRVVLALAAVEPEEVVLIAADLQFRLDPLLCLLYRDEQDIVTLHVPLTFLVLHPVLCQVVVLIIDGDGDGNHHHRCRPHHYCCCPCPIVVVVAALAFAVALVDYCVPLCCLRCH
jgi:hypothetical protein